MFLRDIKNLTPNTWRSRKKSNFCVMLHFAIIQRTKSTPHDYKICTPWIWTFYETVYIGLFTSSSKLKALV